ncbi:hypothetical protein LIA77_11726 [Sarocladium implicatum]|nr:hypothetical protein LIA77_11726 [Sarocladium implicatum]
MANPNPCFQAGIRPHADRESLAARSSFTWRIPDEKIGRIAQVETIAMVSHQWEIIGTKPTGTEELFLCSAPSPQQILLSSQLVELRAGARARQPLIPLPSRIDA